MATEAATLGGGCFWCLEAVFARLRGVDSVVSGYAGGRTKNPTYEQVCAGGTGHVEVVQVTFDPAEITYRQLLEVFFTVHDPTTPNRQGADVGEQYRSVVFAHFPAQDVTARAVVAELTEAKVFSDPIVTTVEPLGEFWPAEPEHHRYYDRNPSAGYCRAVIAPKVAKLRSTWAPLLRDA